MVSAMNENDYITLEEAAECLGGVSTRTVRRRIDKHGWDSRLDTLPDGRKVRVVSRSDVIEHVREKLPAVMRDNGSDVLPRDMPPVSLSEDTQRRLDRLNDNLATVGEELRASRQAENRRWWASVVVGLVVLGAVGGFAMYCLRIVRGFMP